MFKDLSQSLHIVETIRKRPYAKEAIITVANIGIETCVHSVRVAKIASGIGRQAGLNDYELEMLELGGLLHDIGKKSIPIEILNKIEKLSQEEIENYIKPHSYIGYQMVMELLDRYPKYRKEIILLANLTFEHHKFKKEGAYPDESISGYATTRSEMNTITPRFYLLQQILALADYIEARTDKMMVRGYVKRISFEEALEEASRELAVSNNLINLLREKGMPNDLGLNECMNNIAMFIAREPINN